MNELSTALRALAVNALDGDTQDALHGIATQVYDLETENRAKQILVAQLQASLAKIERAAFKGTIPSGARPAGSLSKAELFNVIAEHARTALAWPEAPAKTVVISGIPYDPRGGKDHVAVGGDNAL